MQTYDEAIRVIAKLARVFETELADESMSIGQFRLLAFLSDGESAASVLADWLAVSRPSITSLVDGLVEKGWVAREHSPDDRRRVLHHLTDAGHARLAAANAQLSERLDALLDHLDPDDRRAAADGLALVGSAFRREREAVRS